MLRREGDALIPEGPVTLDSVPALAAAAEEALREGVAVIDFSRVTDVDSSALALTLEWMRQAERAGRRVRLVNLPESMRKLGELYGISEIIRSDAG